MDTYWGNYPAAAGRRSAVDGRAAAAMIYCRA